MCLRCANSVTGHTLKCWFQIAFFAQKNAQSPWNGIAKRLASFICDENAPGRRAPRAFFCVITPMHSAVRSDNHTKSLIVHLTRWDFFWCVVYVIKWRKIVHMFNKMHWKLSVAHKIRGARGQWWTVSRFFFWREIFFWNV